MKIAHISDLHLSKIKYDISQFFSKRWIGNLNTLLFRKRIFKVEQLLLLNKLFEAKGVDYIIVSGDISSTSLESEFEAGKIFFQSFSAKKLFLPGNHDNYTKKAKREMRFYKYFENIKKDKISSLKDDLVEAIPLKNGWWFLAIDATLPTNLLSSKGIFSKKIEENMKKLLKKIPPKDFIIVSNHFPFLRMESPRRELKRASFLKKILKEHKNIKFYLHGHTHRQSILDVRKKGLPIILDSGSAAHNNIGKWNLLNIDKNGATVETFHFKKEEHLWEKINSINFIIT